MQLRRYKKLLIKKIADKADKIEESWYKYLKEPVNIIEGQGI